MKNFYFGIQVEVRDGKYYAYVEKANESNNLLCKFKNCNCKKVICINIFETKKRAMEAVNKWNNSFKNNHTNAFDFV